MTRLAVALLLLGCATTAPPSQQVTQPLPAAASFVIPRVTHWELSFPAVPKLLVRPDGAVLAVAAETPGVLRVVVIDPVSLQIVRRLPPFAVGEVFADWTLGPDALYLLVDRPDDERHVLIALDPVTLDERGRSDRPGSVHAVVDHAFPPVVEAGPHGVHVRFRLWDDKRGNRVVDEMHALGDVARILPTVRDESNVSPPPAPWTFDPHKGQITGAGQSVPCPVHGESVGQPVWSGRRMFVATEGCCGGEPGGLFVCEVSE